MALQMAVRLRAPPTMQPPSLSSKVISGASDAGHFRCLSDGASTLWLHLQVALGYDLTLHLIPRKRIISVLWGYYNKIEWMTCKQVYFP